MQALNNLVASIALAQAAAKLSQQQQGVVPAPPPASLASLFPGFGVTPPVQSPSGPPGVFGAGNFHSNNPAPAPHPSNIPANNPNSHIISQLQQTMAAAVAAQKAEQEQNKPTPPTPQLSQKEKHAMELKAAFEEQQKALRMAYEKTLREAEAQEESSSSVSDKGVSSGIQGQTVNPEANKAITPAEQLQRSYEAHLASLKKADERKSQKKVSISKEAVKPPAVKSEWNFKWKPGKDERRRSRFYPFHIPFVFT